MIELPEEFKRRMSAALGDGYGAFLESYNRPPERAIRVNTIKISVENFKKISPFFLSPVEWEQNGFFVESEAPGKTVLHAAGAYYVQEPSAMSAVPELGVKAGERVLDLCSAPGGKGTQIAQCMNGEGTLVLNEPILSRRDILAENVERLGVTNAVITCATPDFLSGYFKEYFDKILVDAPCSGEGMFRKEPKSVCEWSPSTVEMCAQRQADILASADRMLCGGGRLVYSTCTFSEQEDEFQIENFLKSHKEYSLVKMKKLLPHTVRGEGHFVAVLQKNEGERAEEFPLLETNIKRAADRQYREWESATLNARIGTLAQYGDMLMCFRKGARDLTAYLPKNEKWRFRQSLFLGKTDAANRTPFTPSHGLAKRLDPSFAKSIEVDEETAINYLRGFTFECAQELKGWYLVTFEGLSLGWCKAVNGVAKNHLPKGIRI